MAARLCLTLLLCALPAAHAGRDYDDDDVGAFPLQDLDKGAQIAALQLEAEEAQRAAMPYLDRLAQLRERQKRVDDGWFFQGSAAKAMNGEIALAEKEAQDAQYQVDVIRKQIKPLYGVVSVEHLAEHREVIYKSFQQATNIGKQNMWWEMMFSRRSRDDSLEGILVGLLISFLTGLSIGYVMGLVQFIFSAPFVIYEYCSSVLDIPAALAMFVVGILLFLLPVIVLYYGMVAASKMRRHAGPPRRRQHHNEEYYYQRQQYIKRD